MMALGLPRRMLGLVALTLVLLTLGAPRAAATSDDQIDMLAVAFTVNPDGSVLVRERIVWRFGSNSSRHGLERWLVTRGPYDDQRDLVFDITDPRVTSPDPVSTTVMVQRDLKDGRSRLMRVRVGDGTRTIGEPTASYELSYTVRGAVRTLAGFDELDWNVTGPRLPRVLAASVTVDAPGGVTHLFCSPAAAGSGSGCPTTVQNQAGGALSASAITAGSPFSITATFGSGRVAGAGPILVENADLVEQRIDRTLIAVGAIGALLVPLIGGWYYRQHGHDRRFDGLPAGVLPAAGETPPEVVDPGVDPPLRPEPPQVSLAEAGFLLEGRPLARHTTATLVGLAVDGAIRLKGGRDPEARLLDSRRARDGSSAALLDELFDAGATVADLSLPGTLAEGHDSILAAAEQGAEREQWFVRPPRDRAVGTLVIAALALGYVAYILLGDTVLYLAPLVVSTVATLVLLNLRLRRGQRTGLGRALTDQVEGFRRYLATVQADELVVKEGEDLLSRYLPWAILFDLTERWTTVCGRLVAQGRLAAGTPAWHEGSPWSLAGVPGQVAALNADVRAAITAPDFSGRV